MALTVTLSGDWMESIGNKRAVRATIAFDSSYPTGGESLTAANLGLGTIEYIRIDPKAGYVFEYDYTNKKVLAYRSGAVAAHTHTLHFNNADVADGAGTRVNIGTNLMGANTGADVSVAGVADTSGAGGIVNSGAVSAAALAEVGDTTDLSSVTGVRVYATGY